MRKNTRPAPRRRYNRDRVAFLQFFWLYIIHKIKCATDRQSIRLFARIRELIEFFCCSFLLILFFLLWIISLFVFPLLTLKTDCGIFWNKRSSPAGAPLYISLPAWNDYV